MKKQRIPFAVLLLVSMISVGALTSGTVDKSPRLTIRVTSSDSKEQLAFGAALLFSKVDGKLEYGEKHTPFTISQYATDGFVSGIFQKTDGHASLIVELINATGQDSPLVKAEGSVIVLSTTATDKPPTYTVQEFNK